MQKKFKVKLLPDHTAKPDQIINGYLGNSFHDGKITEYTRGEAIKKASMFGGKIEEVKKAIPMPQLSADELLTLEGISEQQKHFLETFIEIWYDATDSEKERGDDAAKVLSAMFQAWVNTQTIEAESKEGFIVLQVLGWGGFQPVFHEDENLMFFDTEEEANAEIQTTIDDVAESVAKGDMSDNYSTDDYRVVPATLTGTRIECTVDGDRYGMERTDDDYTLITE